MSKKTLSLTGALMQNNVYVMRSVKRDLIVGKSNFTGEQKNKIHFKISNFCIFAEMRETPLENISAKYKNVRTENNIFFYFRVRAKYKKFTEAL